jgi:hypothetical protein
MTVRFRINRLAAQSVRKYTKLQMTDPYRYSFPERDRQVSMDPVIAQMLWAGR